ncbi:MAG: TRAP transporter substrate-binding protein [Stomatobaculum sp.]
MRKQIAITLTAAITAASLVACGGSTTATTAAQETTTAAAQETQVAEGAEEYAGLEPVTLTLADSAAKGAAGSEFDALIAEKAEEITGGKLTIETYLNGELGNDVDLIRQMMSDDIDMVGCQIAPVVSFIPELAIFDLPMVFAKYDGNKIHEVLTGDSKTRAALDAAYNAQGLQRLGILQNATYRLTTANRNLRTLSDFAGLQIRTMENSNHMAFWTAIGAEPTPLTWAEVYIALQNGTIEAEENAADTVVGANLNEVQDYLACTNHILYANQISINKEKFDSLDPAYQEALMQAVEEAMDEMRVKLVDIDTDNKKILSDAGMEIIEYDNTFFDEILAIDGVKELYGEINDATGGLAQTLQDELAQ